MYLIGIDLGTTAVKTVLFDPEGSVIDVRNHEYPTEYPSVGAAEQDPIAWWEATADSIKSLMAAQPKEKRNVGAISVSSQAPTMLPLDKQGKPLRKAIIWMDRRSDEQCEYLKSTIGGERIFATTGNIVDAYFLLPKLLYFRDTEPELFEQTEQLLQANGYIAYRLSGEYSYDRASAGLSLLYDYRSRTWSDELFNELSLDKGLFGPIRESHEILGRVIPSLSEELGFASPPLVLAGTVDGSAAAIESGTVDPHIVCDTIGTSSVIMAVVDTDVTHDKLAILPHVIPDVNLMFGSMSSTGASLKWFRDEFGQPERIAADLLKASPYALMDSQVEGLGEKPSGLIFLPYLMGERSPLWDSTVRSMFFGITASTTRAEIVKSIMEGVAFGLKHNIEELESKDLTFNEIRAIGGGSNSDVWNQMKADITGIPVTLPTTSIGAPFGDAAICAYALGYISDYREFIDRNVKIKKVYEPRKGVTAMYEELFSLYKRLYLDNKENYERLHQIRLSLDGGS